MRAAVVATPGPAHVIKVIETPTPSPEPHEVLITVDAATVNPVDIQTRSGIYHKLGWVDSPSVGLGWDAIGTVTEVGSAVQGLAVGDRIAALIGGINRPLGAYAEQAVVAAHDAALVPAELSTELAATIPLNATTAAQGLDLIGEAKGRALLVTGAAGSVGGYVLELARSRGYSVTGLARPSDESFISGTGAKFITTLPTDPSFDAVFDAAGLGDSTFACMFDDAAYIGVIPIAQPKAARNINVQAVTANADGALLTDLLAAAAAGRITPRVHSLLSLSQASEAHELFERGGVRGRIVLKPQS